MEAHPLSFIGEPIEVEFDQAPALEKVPDCPDRFTWRGEVYHVLEMLREWHDYRRRGKMARNMCPRHLEMASQRGSWGVGRDYFRVRACLESSQQRGRSSGSEDAVAAASNEAPSSSAVRVFDLYYDRAPSAGGPKGGWFLYREARSG